MQIRSSWILVCAGINLILAQYWTMKEYLLVLASSEGSILIAASVVSFYAMLGIWLLGGLVGLLIRKDSVTVALMTSSLCADYAFGLAVRQYPYDLHLLPLYLGLIFATELYSGYFFRHAQA